MKIAIMQPYFLPYIGYFQLMNAVDEFVIYDNIQYTKKGWINRNRILVNGQDSYITLPLKSDSDYLNIVDRILSDSWQSEKLKLLNRIKSSYLKAPYFETVFPLISTVVLFEDHNLFRFIENSLLVVKNYLNISTPLITSSKLDIDSSLKSEKKVISISQSRSASMYINPIGGVELYSQSNFRDAGIQLHFLKTDPIVYKQFQNEFIPFLSIVDVMMFNSQESVKHYLGNYSLQ